MRALGTAHGLLLAALSSGCYSTFATPPPPLLPATSFDCTDSYALPALDTLFLVAAVAMPAKILYDMSTDQADIGEVALLPLLALPLLFGGYSAVDSAVSGYSGVANCQRLKRDRHVQETRVAARKKDRERAWEITKGAADAARVGDCAAVIQRDGEVRHLDPEFHGTVFRRDVAIGRCIDAHAGAGIDLEQPAR